MTDDTDKAPLIDFESRRRERLHLVHDARLEKMRSEFEKAFSLPGKPKKPSKKNKKPRKS